jgi:hypothetical protein
MCIDVPRGRTTSVMVDMMLCFGYGVVGELFDGFGGFRARAISAGLGTSLIGQYGCMLYKTGHVQ